MKSSNKKWLSHHSAHDYQALLVRWKDLATKLGLDMVSLSRQTDYEVIGLRGGGQKGGSGLYLSAGVHGDEPAAVWALLEWAEANQKVLLEESMVILPCVNPWGLTHNVRFDRQGRDLNRMFQNETLPFFRSWRKFVGDQQFRLALNLHEDYAAQGVYVYELVPKGVKISDGVLDQVETLIPREHRAHIDGQRFKAGIFRRAGNLRKAVERDFAGGYPEAIYLYLNHARAALTFETPSEFAFHERVRAQKKFIEGVLKV